jgi:hypothetical protein
MIGWLWIDSIKLSSPKICPSFSKHLSLSNIITIHSTIFKSLSFEWFCNSFYHFKLTILNYI